MESDNEVGEDVEHSCHVLHLPKIQLIYPILQVSSFSKISQFIQESTSVKTSLWVIEGVGTLNSLKLSGYFAILELVKVFYE